jgi:hypothetical protein
MSPVDYFKYGAEVMMSNPRYVTDWSIVAGMKRIGLEPGKNFDASKAGSDVLAKGAAEAEAHARESNRRSPVGLTAGRCSAPIGGPPNHAAHGTACANDGQQEGLDAVRTVQFSEHTARHVPVGRFRKGGSPTTRRSASPGPRLRPPAIRHGLRRTALASRRTRSAASRGLPSLFCSTAASAAAMSCVWDGK